VFHTVAYNYITNIVVRFNSSSIFFLFWSDLDHFELAQYDIMIFCRAAGCRLSHQGIKNWEILIKFYILVFLAKESTRNENISSLWLKGIFQLFELGSETRLIRSAVLNWEPSKF
jgi:hypothetical protein